MMAPRSEPDSVLSKGENRRFRIRTVNTDAIAVTYLPPYFMVHKVIIELSVYVSFYLLCDY